MFAASKSGRAASAAATDPYFPYVPLLLETTTTNGQQNNTFLDSSANNFTITRNGTPTQGSVTPYWPNGYWSTNLNGSTDTLTTVSGAMSYAGDFSIECWFNTTTTTTYACLYSDETGTTGGTILLNNGANNGQIVVFIGSAVSTFTSTSTGLNNGTWNHVALTRSGSTVRLFINGALQNTTTASGTITTTSTVRIGSSFFASRFFGGYISNFRIVVGSPVYTAAFTPSTTPLTAITNTSLLTCQSNRFIDNSANNRTITVVSTPKVQAFQPFSPAASYTAAAYGGSGYFSTSNYLTAPASTSWQFTGDYTLEAWIYLVSLASDGTIYGTGGVGAADQFTYTSTGQLFWAGQGTAAGVITTNQWLHVAAARSGTTLKIFVNGVTQLTATVSGTTGQNLTAYIARRSDGNNPVNGYISNLRIVNGTAVYTANFTPPTAPVTAITNTSLLLNGTNAGIYDAAVQNNQITVGDAQASTTQYKWSPTSMKFDGTGDWLTMPGTNIPALSGQFTIEFWVYFSSISATFQTICGKWNTSLFGWVVQVNNTSVQFSYGNGVTFTAALSYATTLTTGTWYYIAITRNSSNAIRAYLNGTAIGSPTTVSTSINSTAAFAVGVNLDGSQQPLNGYLQDFRLTNGVARTITTPTAAFPTR